MAQPYQQIRDGMDPTKVSDTILRVADQAHIPNDPANRDRAEYEAWLAEGNVPDPPPPPTLPDPSQIEPLKLPRTAPVEPYDAVPKAYLDGMVQPLIQRIAALEAKLGS
jgi:hypothetical protein